MERRPRYVFYAATDGVGTHIVRGLFVRLANEGLKVSTESLALWQLGARYIFESDSLGGKKAACVAAINDALAKIGLEPVSANPSSADLFKRIETEARKSDVTLDFSRMLCRTDKSRSYKDIANIRKFILSYIAWKDRTIDVRFIIQQRDPLDHIASLHERFSADSTGEEIRQLVLESHDLLKELRADLDSSGCCDFYLDMTLSEIVYNYQSCVNRLEIMLAFPFYRGMYITPVSLNKWPTSPYAVSLINDPQIAAMARDLGIEYPKPGTLGLRFFVWKAQFLRHYYELKIIVDTRLGRVEDTNPINAKHERKLSMLHKVLLRVMPSWREQNKAFYENLKKGSASDSK